MKLAKFNATNTQAIITGKPTVRFAKTGQVSINSHACALLKLKAGDQVELACDEENPEDWFIKKTKLDGFELRAYKGGGGKYLLFNNSALYKKVGDSHNRADDPSTGFLLGKEANKEGYFPLFILPKKSV